MCTTPLGTLRLDFFEPVFFVGVAIRLGLLFVNGESLHRRQG
ncbi:hypothetical protein EV06_1757 [Prochlorococcus sp. MIT 0602]|nr:hypothetical protein EV06_1757 [Prochlorococcus sp. MIT 0602]KGG15873.1 hypothetical protein EV07_1839 [Prochlorococcus sp. MIT 0603]